VYENVINFHDSTLYVKKYVDNGCDINIYMGHEKERDK